MTLVLFCSCSLFEMKVSPNRTKPPKEIEISPDLTISSTGAIFFNFAGMVRGNFVSAGIKINYKDLIIYIDPLLAEEKEKADFILISHDHPDHFSPEDIKKLSGDQTIIYGPESVTEKLKDYKTISVRPGDNIQNRTLKFEVVYAYNLNSRPLHKKGDNNLGYVISCGFERIYHAGDTDFIPEMKELENISVALLPIGIGKTAMNPSEAAMAAAHIMPDLVIPMHYDPDDDAEARFMENLHKELKCELLQ